MSQPAAGASASSTTTYTTDDIMNQANAAVAYTKAVEAAAQAALTKRAQVVLHNSDGSTTNVNIHAGSDVSVAPSNVLFFTVAN